MESYSISVTNHKHAGYISVHAECQHSTQPYSPMFAIIVKRKRSDEFTYTTVCVGTNIVGENKEELNFIDPYCRNGYTYQYRIEFCGMKVIDPTGERYVATHTEETNVYSEFDGLVIADSEEVWFTPLNVAPINTTRIKPYVINTPMYAKKPSYYNYTATNYKEGTCTGIFVQINCTENGTVLNTSHNWQYRDRFEEFLTLGNAKVIKSVNGEMWLVGIKTDSITDTSLFSNADIEGARQIEFGWLEIGDVTSEEDLYESGLINVPEEYWSGV